MPKGLLCNHRRITSSSWTILDRYVASPCTAIESLRQTQQTEAGVLLVITGWSCAVVACYITHAKERAQGPIVLAAYICSLWLASTVPEMNIMHVTFWSITCGLLLSAALHKIWLFLQGETSLQGTESQMWASQDMKQQLDIVSV